MVLCVLVERLQEVEFHALLLRGLLGVLQVRDLLPGGTEPAAGAAAADPRIKIVRRPKNGHISAATNSALALATGEFVALMDHDDLLPERALYQVAAVLDRHPDADLIYSDEDKIDDDGRRGRAGGRRVRNDDEGRLAHALASGGPTSAAAVASVSAATRSRPLASIAWASRSTSVRRAAVKSRSSASTPSST